MTQNKVSKIALKLTCDTKITLNINSIKNAKVYKLNSNTYNCMFIMWHSYRKRIRNYVVKDFVNEEAAILDIAEWDGVYHDEIFESATLVIDKGNVARSSPLSTTLEDKADVVLKIAQECVESPSVDSVLLKYLKNKVIIHADYAAIREVANQMMTDMENEMKRSFALQTKLKPWQKELADLFDTAADRRSIYWIYDKIGNTGKTFLGSYLEGLYPQQVVNVQSTKADAILYCLQDVHYPRGVILDMTRSKGGEYISYDLIEQIKAGNILSTKYKPRRRHFRPIHVFIMSNGLPEVRKLSLDRWQIIEIITQEDSKGCETLRWYNQKDLVKVECTLVSECKPSF